jgi:hypothetical protein
MRDKQSLLLPPRHGYAETRRAGQDGFQRGVFLQPPHRLMPPMQKVWVARMRVAAGGSIPWFIDSELGPARSDWYWRWCRVPRYAVVEAPSALGHVPEHLGVERAPQVLLGAGLAEGLAARRAGRVEAAG